MDKDTNQTNKSQDEAELEKIVDEQANKYFDSINYEEYKWTISPDLYENVPPDRRNFMRLVDDNAARNVGKWLPALKITQKPINVSPIQFVSDVKDIEQDKATDLIAQYLNVAPLVYINDTHHKDMAETILQRVFTHADTGEPTLIRVRGEYWRWHGGFWMLEDEETVHSTIKNIFDETWRVIVRRTDTNKAGQVTTRLTHTQYKPKSNHPKAYESFLRALVAKDSMFSTTRNRVDLDNRWMCDRPKGYPAAIDCVVVQNGILDITRAKLHPHHPGLFTPIYVNCPWDPTAKSADLDQFWATVFGDHDDQEDLAEEIFSMLLVNHNRPEKICRWNAPTRAGKGTLASLLEALVNGNVTTWRVSTANSDWILQDTEGSAGIFVWDGRKSDKFDDPAFAELLLTISGGDTVRVDRRYLRHLQMKLHALIVLISNPTGLELMDPTSVLAGRMITLKSDRSFLGKEDVTLKDRLLADALPALLVRLVRGHQRLIKNGFKFTETTVTKEAEREMRIKMNPVLEFVKECCTVGYGLSVEKYDFRDALEHYCGQEGAVMPDQKTHLLLINQAMTALNKQLVKEVRGSKRTVPDYKNQTENGQPGEKTIQPYEYRGIALTDDVMRALERRRKGDQDQNQMGLGLDTNSAAHGSQIDDDQIPF